MTMRERHTLIVGDYPDALYVRALCLRALGYRASTAADGATTLRKAERLIPAAHDTPLIPASGFAIREGGQPSHSAGQLAQENG
jgi:CheY-like chemotaxis protein